MKTINLQSVIILIAIASVLLASCAVISTPAAPTLGTSPLAPTRAPSPPSPVATRRHPYWLRQHWPAHADGDDAR
jgi:hypothetical protein